MKLTVLDHGYVELIECWGQGKAGDPFHSADYEIGIIEAARQSTQGSFRGWEGEPCNCSESDPDFEKTGVHEDTCAQKQNPGDRKLLNYLYDNKHSTPFEFAGMTIEVQAPIFVFREWHRHRTFSYSEASARYAPLENLNYMPSIERLMLSGGANKQAGAVKGAAKLTEAQAVLFQQVLAETYEAAEFDYQTSLGCGVPKELARLCLPVGRYSKMRATGNLRNWLQFLALRLDANAQWEIRQYARVVADMIKMNFPNTYAQFIKELNAKAASKTEG